MSTTSSLATRHPRSLATVHTGVLTLACKITCPTSFIVSQTCTLTSNKDDGAHQQDNRQPAPGCHRNEYVFLSFSSLSGTRLRTGVTNPAPANNNQQQHHAKRIRGGDAGDCLAGTCCISFCCCAGCCACIADIICCRCEMCR
ncbi:hypothetical protein V8E55_011714 [Tylopilus felleus]